MDERTTLESVLRAAGVEAALAGRLAEYGALLLQANRRVNLTGADSAEDLAPHIVDSLTLVPFVAGRLVDIGSGGGLPAIPAALATGVPVTLVESVAKKAAFLESVIREIRFEGRVVPARAEQAARDPDLRDRFDCATARAVASAPTVLELAAPFLRAGGRALLQRGRLDLRERNAVIDAAPILGARFAEEIATEGDRRILIFEKTAPTPQRFPRRTGVPERRPLCLL